MSEVLAAILFTIQGRVQGVGFRAWAAQDARRLGLTGWVRNASDGSVELYAEGPVNALEELYARLRQGNGLSTTVSIQQKRVTPQGYTRFSITY